MPPRKKNAPVPKRSSSQPGDKIDVSNQGERSAIAAGRHAIAAVLNINIRELKWQPVVLILLIVGALLAAILWFVVPRSSPVMTGQFNVAVAEFLVQDKDGRTIGGDDGWQLADYVAGQIKTQFRAIGLDKVVPNDVWGPDKVVPIKGQTIKERKKKAQEVAERLHAQVLIYGVIDASGKQPKFSPEFYINHKGFWQASEIEGAHEMGSPLNVTLPVSESIQAIENPALAGRVNALDLITIGLAYYSVDDYQNAADYFQKACDEQRWFASSGKEVAYLLLGNAYVGWASKENDEKKLPLAENSYSQALNIKPNYGRGLVGLANVLYLRSLGPLNEVDIDLDMLEKAARLTEEALNLKDQPDEANIPAKAHFNLGQIALARYKAGLPGQDWTETARQEFSFVTHEYEAGNTALETYAAHAYLRLGVIEYAQNKNKTTIEDSIALIQKAIDLAPPFYKGEYSITLGNVYRNTGQKDLANQAYQNAIAFAEANGDPKSAERYQQSLNQLNQP